MERTTTNGFSDVCRWLFLFLGLMVGFNQAIEEAVAGPKFDIDTTTIPHDRLNRTEKRMMSQTAGRLLHHVHQARQALDRHNRQEAQRHVKQGQTLASIMTEVMPTYTVEVRIQAGDLVYNDSETVQPLLVPVYGGMEKVAIIAPIVAAKRAEASAQRAAGESLGTPVEVRYTRILLDVAGALQHLLIAEKALMQADAAMADRSLRTLQVEVIFDYDAAEEPLAKAGEQLLLARQMLQEQRLEEASFGLQRAATSLTAYAETTSDQRAHEARELSQKIETLAASIEREQEGAADLITTWWDQIVQWYEYFGVAL